MKANPSLLSWLDHLRHLLPPSGIVLVGAGTGTGPWVQYLQNHEFHSVTLIEADPLRFQLLRQATAPRNDWQLRCDVVAQQAGPVTFHQANLSSESGLLKPESLRGIWSNLGTKGETTLDAITLDDLSNQLPAPFNWLFLDCLTAQSVIQGGVRIIDNLDVVVARVVSEDTCGDHDATRLSSLRSLLEGHGFRFLALEACRHPALGHALFLRNPMFPRPSCPGPSAQTGTSSPGTPQVAFESNPLTQRLEEEALAGRMRIAQLEEETQTSRERVLQLENELSENRSRAHLQASELQNAEEQLQLIKELLLQEETPKQHPTATDSPP